MGKHNKDFRRNQNRMEETQVLDSEAKEVKEETTLQGEEVDFNLFEEPEMDTPEVEEPTPVEDDLKALNEEKETVTYEEPVVENTVEEVKTFSTENDLAAALYAKEKFILHGVTDDGLDVTGFVYFVPKKKLVILMDGQDLPNKLYWLLDNYVDSQLVLDPNVSFNILCYLPRFLPEPYKLEVKQESNITDFLNYFLKGDYSYEAKVKKLLKIIFEDIIS